jgi:hypothetical protein
LGWLLTALRTATFFGLLVLFLQPHWRSEREMVRNSRVLLLVDTSLSMGVADGDSSSAGAAGSRAQQVISALAKTDFLARLRQVHDVAVFPFSEDLSRDHVVSLPKQIADAAGDSASLPALTEEKGVTSSVPDWAKLLAPTGIETRLGQALRQLIQTERGAPVSGVVVLSDGGQNAGISPESAVELATEAKIPVFAVGLGSDRQPTNVSVSDLAVPARAYPGDRYTVTGYVQAHGMRGRVATVQLLGRPANDAADAARHGTGQLIESRQVALGSDGEVVPVKFELTPDAPGRRTL